MYNNPFNLAYSILFTCLMMTMVPGFCETSDVGAYPGSSMPADSSTKTREIHAFMSALLARGQFTGSIIVADHGTIIYQNAFGLADREKNIPFALSTQEYVGSLSKAFTAAGIMILRDRKKLSYDAPVRYFFPALPTCMQSVTIRHLLQHTSGLAVFDDTPDMTQKDVFNILLKQEDLRFMPGEKFEYCNAGYSLLGMIIEKISGQSLNDFLTANIFKPLDMQHTSVNDISHRNTERAIGYTLYGTQNNYDTFMGGNASVISTAEDLYKWDQALYNPKFIGKATWNELFKKNPIVLPDGVYGPKWYSFGWWIADYNGSPTLFHDGAFGGYRAYIERLTGEKSTIIHISNLRHNIMMDIRTGIVNILNGKPYVLPKISVGAWMYQQYASDGIDKAIEQYKNLKASPEQDQYNYTESELNSLGYFLMRENKLQDAVRIFELNTEEYPSSGNTHDSLGEAYMKIGEKEKAIASYRKSLELDPGNGNAKQMLEELTR